MGVRDSAELCAMFIFSFMTEEVSIGEAQEILTASGEIDIYELDALIEGLCERGILYRTDNTAGAYIGITENGAGAVEALSEKRTGFASAINKARRVYRRITTGVEFYVDMQKNGKGTDVIFGMRLYGQERLSTKIYFENSTDALTAYNKMDSDPDAVYNGILTVATGKVEFLFK